jgi:hypothetical protein
MSAAREAAGLPARRVRIGAAVGWTALILFLCLLPADWWGLPVVEEDYFRIPLPSPDKLIHFTLFAGFAVLWVAAGWPRYWVAATIAAGLALAVGTEVLQNVPALGRDGNVMDTLADGLGVLAGAAIAPLYLRRRAAGRVSEKISTEPVDGPPGRR